jgi:hypothetical protein
LSDERASALRLLVAYELPVERTIAKLAAFGWDAPVPLVWLTATDVQRILERYTSGELSAEQVTHWADLVECREDISVLKAEAYLGNIVFRLANPYLNAPITHELVAELKREIQRAQRAALPFIKRLGCKII